MFRLIRNSKMLWSGMRCFGLSQHWSSTVRSSLFAADSLAAKEMVAVVNPDLDFDHLFSNLEHHQKVLQRRGHTADLQALMQRWQRWEELAIHLQQLKDPKRSGICADEKQSTKKSLEIEARFMYDVLALPNWLLPENVAESDQVIHRFHCLPKFAKYPKSHFEIASQLQQLLPAVTGSSFYLMGQAAHLESLAQRRFSEQFLARRFEPLSCPDLLKPVVVEGSGIDIDDPRVMKLTPNSKDDLVDVKTLRLAGSASLPALAAYFTRVKFRSVDLPRSYYSLGRTYQRSNVPLHCGGLYNSNQAMSLAFIILMAEKPFLEFELAVEHLKNIFTEIGVHFHLVEMGAKNLAREESRRCRVEMWSVTHNCYVPVAFVSVIDDYISRRLICCYDDTDIVDGRHYINMVHGQINITHLLAAIIENTQDAGSLWHIPEFFTQG